MYTRWNSPEASQIIGSSSAHLAAVHDLSRRLLHLLQLGHEVPEPGLGNHVVRGEDPHAVQRRSGAFRRRQAPPDHLVLPQLGADRERAVSGSAPACPVPGPAAAAASSGAAAILAARLPAGPRTERPNPRHRAPSGRLDPDPDPNPGPNPHPNPNPNPGAGRPAAAPLTVPDAFMVPPPAGKEGAARGASSPQPPAPPTAPPRSAIGPGSRQSPPCGGSPRGRPGPSLRYSRSALRRR